MDFDEHLARVEQRWARVLLRWRRATAKATHQGVSSAWHSRDAEQAIARVERARRDDAGQRARELLMSDVLFDPDVMGDHAIDEETVSATTVLYHVLEENEEILQHCAFELELIVRNPRGVDTAARERYFRQRLRRDLRRHYRTPMRRRTSLGRRRRGRRVVLRARARSPGRPDDEDPAHDLAVIPFAVFCRDVDSWLDGANLSAQNRGGA